ncbi:Sin3 histone deacetylase corepressor complex like protein [Argiope bruennichi]|uniref:Sin3 histone deacetylase corepressor complex like protein n=1 Tax=Argiope bruennichi TaxID=94029 RepID=A0A8T0F937_ARGBR|nr:Sin3 histone deacetylase corepressor complex like protein [Argiope bruennichi]
MVKQEEEYTEIKEQMYQDKLANLKKQLKQLEEGVHPDYLKRLKKLEQNYQTRQLLNQVFERVEIERVERDHILEKEAAHKEYEEKKVELRETLISDLEEKKRMIEAERSSMELTSDKSSLQLADHAIARRLILEDSMEVKPVTTRKLRRRPNDPLPVPEKRRKTLPTLNFLLDDNEIMEDLRLMNRNKSSPSGCEGSPSDQRATSIEVKVEDGKLYYDKKWYHRGQQIYYEGKEIGTKNSGLICTINPTEVWIKRTSDGNKIRIYISQLQKGKITIRRRSA